MAKTKYDYSGFRLSKLRDPRFSHFLLLLGWLGYFLMYFLTENLIAVENCHPVHCSIDDMIPFCEWFVIPYVGWYFLIIFSLLWFAFYNVENFKRLQIFIIVTQIIATVVYIVYPTRQDLRPDTLPSDNLLAGLVGLLYSADTNTGVCPSLHCAYSIGIASMWLKERNASVLLKSFIVIFVVLVCLSTMFIKQHSAVDFFASIPVCIVAEYISCKGYYKKRFGKLRIKH
ncbi:MAG: phosphatase PAP2 family protein [Clostridia bacterium]|nr:phosphatase PAP2 family protein [Clostridia bacterium]